MGKAERVPDMDKAHARFHEFMEVLGQFTEKEWKEVVHWLKKKK